MQRERSCYYDEELTYIYDITFYYDNGYCPPTYYERYLIKLYGEILSYGQYLLINIMIENDKQRRGRSFCPTNNNISIMENKLKRKKKTSIARNQRIIEFRSSVLRQSKTEQLCDTPLVTRRVKF